MKLFIVQIQSEKAVVEAERQKLSAEKDVLAKSHDHTKAELSAKDNKLQETTKQVNIDRIQYMIDRNF